MRDEFLENLRNDWTSQDIELDALRRRLARGRWTDLVGVVLVAACALLGTGVGIWFALLAWQRSDVLFALSAFTLLVVALPSAVADLKIRRLMLDDCGDTPEQVLRAALARARVTDTILKIGLWNAVALFVFVGVFWVCVFAGWIPHRYPLVLFSCVWIVAAATALGWCLGRLRRNQSARAQCERLLAQYQDVGARET
jgi:hypothetical protein